MSTLPIRSNRMAYNVGFSSAMDPASFSAFNELTKWAFEGSELDIRSMHVAFKKGYADSVGRLNQIKYSMHEKGITIPTHLETDRKDWYDHLAGLGYNVRLVQAENKQLA